ncbi:DUF2946 domain-containing protein [Providencia rettgeri]|nr:DUF2946 domain-containing protein [Providencia rettgeri]
MVKINNIRHPNKIHFRPIKMGIENNGKTLHLRPFIRQLAAYLALLAVAMLFIAPLVSKSMEHATACTEAHSETAAPLMHKHQGEVMPENCELSVPMNHMLMTGVGQSPMEDIACGYCQLLIHFPFLILFVAAVIRQLATLAIFIPFERCIQFWLYRLWSLHLARAPPQFLCLSKN